MQCGETGALSSILSAETSGCRQRAGNADAPVGRWVAGRRDNLTRNRDASGCRTPAASSCRRWCPTSHQSGTGAPPDRVQPAGGEPPAAGGARLRWPEINIVEAISQPFRNLTATSTSFSTMLTLPAVRNGAAGRWVGRLLLDVFVFPQRHSPAAHSIHLTREHPPTSWRGGQRREVMAEIRRSASNESHPEDTV
jgi:hypothetical protein